MKRSEKRWERSRDGSSLLGLLFDSLRYLHPRSFSPPDPSLMYHISKLELKIKWMQSRDQLRAMKWECVMFEQNDSNLLQFSQIQTNNLANCVLRHPQKPTCSLVMWMHCSRGWRLDWLTHNPFGTCQTSSAWCLLCVCVKGDRVFRCKQYMCR